MRSISKLWLTLLSLGLASCVAQDPNYLRLKASDLLQVARQKNPQEPRLTNAKELFQEGNKEFIGADYQLARYFFKRSIEVSEEVIEDTDAARQRAKDDEAYVEAQGRPTVPPPPANSRIHAPMPTSVELAMEAPHGTSSELMLPPADELPHGARLQLPGEVVFRQNESAYESSSREYMEGAARFLVSNPGSFLYLKAELGEGEAETLTDARFQAVRGFYKRMGISLSRVKLDEEIGHAEFPVFRLFVVPLR